MTPQATDHDRWVRVLRPVQAHRADRVRLICLPYAGAGTSVFRPWAQYLPAHVELIAVQPPGREDRLLERAVDRLDGVVDVLVDVLAAYLEPPFALFGHSMGAVLAWALACRWEAGAGPSPDRLFVSGSSAPSRTIRRGRHVLPAAELIEQLHRLNGTPPELLANDEMMRLLLPTLRADLAVAEGAADLPGTMLSCPLTVLGGQDDPEVAPAELVHWSGHTTGGCRVHVLPGGHFFIDRLRQETVRCVTADLPPAARPVRGTA